MESWNECEESRNHHRSASTTATLGKRAVLALMPFLEQQKQSDHMTFRLGAGRSEKEANAR